MKFKPEYKNIFQQTLGTMGAFCLLSLIFIGAYLYVDYRNYLSSYKTLQQSELKVTQEKINRNIENIKKLSTLTSKRIASSLGEIKRIQNILTSSHSLLPDAEFLKIQKLTYEKLSKPQYLITRLGIATLESDKDSSDTSYDNAPSIFFDQNRIYSKTWILDQNGQLDGILEIHLALSHFKDTLKIGSTLSFVPDSTHVLLQKGPLSLYGKPPELFWGYFYNDAGHYTIFFLFMIFSLIFIIFTIYYFRFRTRKAFKEEIEILKGELSDARAEGNEANDALFASQKRAETHQATCQSYKNFQTSFHNRQREQLNHILRSLDVVMRSFKNPHAPLPGDEIMEIIGDCLNVVERLSSGVPAAVKHEPVNVRNILGNVRSLFTEKMYKSDLMMKLHCPENLVYSGDSLFLEFILLNLIGKPLHMIPKNGKIDIEATDKANGLSIHMKDNGFPFNEKSHKQIQQSFDFFMSDESFQQLCRDHGFFYEYTKDKNGLNFAKVVFPKVPEDSLDNNVIPLFNKN